jgi:hypothetical protein
MPTDIPAALDAEPAEVKIQIAPVTGAWLETALTVTFAAATVLFVSFIAVVAGLV